jgi:hypothetical protein
VNVKTTPTLTPTHPHPDPHPHNPWSLWGPFMTTPFNENERKRTKCVHNR